MKYTSNGNRKIRKIIPGNVFDIPAIESWLSDMAKQGLYLVEFGKMFAHFIKGEPQNLEYRLEPMQKQERSPDQEMLEYYKDCGWIYVTQYNGLFYIYRSCGDSVKEIHSDPLTQSYTYTELDKKLRNSAGVVGVLSIATIMMLLSIYVFSEYRVYSMVTGQSVSQFFLLILQVIVIVQQTCYARSIRMLKKRLESGKSLSYRKNYQTSRRMVIALYGFLLLALVFTILIPINSMTRDWEMEASEIDFILPVISLEALEATEEFVYTSEIEAEARKYENYVQYEWSELAPVQYKIHQRGRVEGKLWTDKSGNYEPTLMADYYKLRFSFLAKPFIKDLFFREMRFERYEKMLIEELWDSPFEYAVIVEIGETQKLFAVQGNEVIHLRYHGYGVLREQLDEIAAQMKLARSHA